MKKMRKVYRVLAVALISMMVSGMCVLAEEQEDTKKQEVNVVFTHDLHSHLESFYLEEEGEEKIVGGFARMMTYLKEKRAQEGELLFLDGGDFSMGTLYQTVYESQASELRMLGFLGVDVSTFGNHEFDYRSQGLANMLEAAADSGDLIPPLAVCNIDWEKTLEGAQAEDGALLQKAFEAYGVKPYIMLEKMA